MVRRWGDAHPTWLPGYGRAPRASAFQVTASKLSLAPEWKKS